MYVEYYHIIKLQSAIGNITPPSKLTKSQRSGSIQRVRQKV